MFRIYCILIFVSFAASLSAQEINITSKRKLPVQKKVIDIVIKEDKQFLLTEDAEMVELKKEGAVKMQSSNKLNDFYELKIGEPLPFSIDINSYTYLTKGDEVYYGCIFDWSWSSRIVKINPQTGEEEFFQYLIGIPSGMTYKNGTLWYLLKRSDPKSSAVITGYDGKTGRKLTKMLKVPLSNAKGLSIDSEDVFTTYENKSNSVVSFEIIE